MKSLLTFLLALACSVTALGQPPVKHMTGATLSPRSKLLSAKQFRNVIRDVTPPDNYVTICPSYDMSGNDQYGICVSAEEGNHWRAWTAANGYPMTDVAGSEVIRWAKKHGFLNGANLTEVMDTLKSDGMTDKKGVTHKLKDYFSVDYTNQSEVKSALFTYKTLNIAIASVGVDDAHSSKNGWIQLNGPKSSRIDHCVGLHGYGSLAWLCTQFNVGVPAGADGTQFCVVLYTWGSVGIVNWKSLQNMMLDSEAWARDPGDVPSTPFPTPGPGPSPTFPSLAGALFDDANQPIRGTVTLILTGAEKPGSYSWLIQRDASGQYSPTPRILTP